jgi:ABC-type transporter Mla subunit MlaD
VDPITLTTSFATIVGLICNYKQQQQDQKAASSQDFLQWLDEHRHEELKNLILQTHGLESQVAYLLRRDHKLIMQQLSEIDKILATLLSRVEGFSEIVHILRPNFELSDQALHILRRLVNSQADEFGKNHLGSGGVELVLVSSDPEIEVREPRFLDDDLRTLVDLQLLLPRVGSRGTKFFRVTRNAARLVGALQDAGTAAPQQNS